MCLCSCAISFIHLVLRIHKNQGIKKKSCVILVSGVNYYDRLESNSLMRFRDKAFSKSFMMKLMFENLNACMHSIYTLVVVIAVASEKWVTEITHGNFSQFIFIWIRFEEDNSILIIEMIYSTKDVQKSFEHILLLVKHFLDN